MSGRRMWMVVLIVLGVIFTATAIYYWVTPAGSLPSFVPGHLAGSGHVHVKHGIAALFAGVVCFLGAWMLSGREQTSPGRS